MAIELRRAYMQNVRASAARPASQSNGIVKLMSYSMSQASLPVFEIGLNALTAVLDKASAHAAVKKIDPAVLLGWRLAPDMFALAKQVQVVCDQVKNGSARLAGIEPPKFEDNETTLDQLKERIAKTLGFLKSLDAKAIDASSERELTPKRRLAATGEADQSRGGRLVSGGPGS